ncbi:MAG: adenosylmethionine decarboxylase [Candidatus Moranbacteria bacterium]|nr:adenosylmethionine decarboxylase [Candidatus Moranbacteria bacterium]
MKNSQPNGLHFIFELFGCRQKEIDDIEFLKKVFKKSLEKSSAGILKKHFYKFNPQGVTGYVLLSASHISVHTWPEKKYAAFDVFTCSGKKETKRIFQNIIESINHKEIKLKKIKRGFSFIDKNNG